MNHLALYVVVALSGGCVLALEILGTRILGPFYGVSLYLWSALISVTLAALSLGYFLGGQWADKGPRVNRLASLLAIAGIWVLLVPLLKYPLLSLAEGMGLRTAVLVAASGLFFPPLTLLGMVSPYAIRLRASHLEEVGRAAGNLYAISTIASVVAALLTGFWLIPNFGVLRLTYSIGLVLLLAAGIALWFGGSRSSRTKGSVTLLVPIALGAWGLSTAGVKPEGGLLHHEQSAYAEIRVLEDEGERYLLIDGGVHTIVIPGTWESRFPYVVVSGLARELFEEPGELLLVGLGGGSAAKSFAQEGWAVEAVEIDPVVTRMAHEYFGLLPSEASVHHLDGRRYLASTDEEYDIIFLDAFGSSSIPFHLITQEAFSLVKKKLKPGGVLVLNIETLGWHDILVQSLGKTLDPIFTHVLALPMAEPPSSLGNVILLASDQEMEISDEALGIPSEALGDVYEHWRVVTRNHAWDNRFEPEASGAPVLTDDRNPVDLWSESTNLAARRDLHKSFGRASW